MGMTPTRPRPQRRNTRETQQARTQMDPIISDTAVRLPMVLFLALFTIGAALLIWRGLNSVPEGFHWIDPVMSAVKTFSTFAAMLLIQYLVFAERVYAEVQEEQLRLRFQHGLAAGWKQVGQRFCEGSTDVWTDWTEWLKPPAWKADQNLRLRPGPEPPGVDAASSLRGLNSITDQDDLPVGVSLIRDSHRPSPLRGEV